MKVLVTGGAGYLGSHIVLALLERGHAVVVLDNFENSSAESIRRVEQITNASIRTINADARDLDALSEALIEDQIDSIIHLAALKSVAESVQLPIRYYENNIGSLLTVLKAVENSPSVKRLIFSSSATVYGTPTSVPITENHPTGIDLSNPYARTKYFGEEILKDFIASHPQMCLVSLRYFNPIGAHRSGMIGESPTQPPNNLAPIITQVAVGSLKHVDIFGQDYPTPDGTGVRDYIHVVDLAEGHILALEKAVPGFKAFNLGTGRGTSVLELISYFEEVIGREIPKSYVNRRQGDVAESFANVSLARLELGWEAKFSVQDACRDAWLWQEQNPEGYE